jgi:hypothetical protein
VNLNRRVAVFPLNGLKSIDISRGVKKPFQGSSLGFNSYCKTKRLFS